MLRRGMKLPEISPLRVEHTLTLAEFNKGIVKYIVDNDETILNALRFGIRSILHMQVIRREPKLNETELRCLVLGLKGVVDNVCLEGDMYNLVNPLYEKHKKYPADIFYCNIHHEQNNNYILRVPRAWHSVLLEEGFRYITNKSGVSFQGLLDIMLRYKKTEKKT